MARRLVRHQAALIVLALVALAACSRRGCACAAGYAPEIGVADLDPLAFDVWLPHEFNSGGLSFALGQPKKTNICTRLPDATTATVDGVKLDVNSLGGATGTKAAGTICREAHFFWPRSPVAAQTSMNIVLDDGSAKVACTLGVGLPLRLTTPSVKTTGESVALLLEIGAPGSTLSVSQAQVGVEGEDLLMPLPLDAIRLEGSRASLSVPATFLAKSEKHRLVVDAMIAPDVTCVPKRKHSATALVHLRSIFSFTAAK